MKKHFSKTISFLLVGLLVLGLFIGCSNNNGTTNTTDKNKTENGTTDTTDKNKTENSTNNTTNNSNTDKNSSTNTNTEKTFTLDELAKYDGKNGQPAYIAVDGVVYDVTNNFPNG